MSVDDERANDEGSPNEDSRRATAGQLQRWLRQHGVAFLALLVAGLVYTDLKKDVRLLSLEVERLKADSALEQTASPSARPAPPPAAGVSSPHDSPTAMPAAGEETSCVLLRSLDPVPCANAENCSPLARLRPSVARRVRARLGEDDDVLVCESAR